jgi:hypothetical protein
LKHGGRESTEIEELVKHHADSRIGGEGEDNIALILADNMAEGY